MKQLFISLLVSLFAFVILTACGDKDDVNFPVADQTAEVSIQNLTDTQPFSPAAFLVHTNKLSIYYVGMKSPKEFEPLAELGDPTDFIELAEGENGVILTKKLDSGLGAGESTGFELNFSCEDDISYLSAVMMATATNDGVALANSIPLCNGGSAVESSNDFYLFDNGTEENQEPRGGFDAGQPDPERGDENVNNGTPTDPQADFALHPQFEAPVLRVKVRPVR